MLVSQNEAAHALREVEEAARHSQELHGYRMAAPHLMLWGGAYFAAYTYGFFRPQQAGLAWAVAVPLAVAGDFWISARDKPCAASASFAGTFGGLFATFLAFITATSAIMQPHDPRQMAAFVPLVVAVAYIVLGFSQGRRLMLTGVALGVLTLFGYFALPGLFLLWMAVVGGGALMAGGLWLRQA